MRPEDVRPGLRVWYSPSPGLRFQGTVREDPWQLGGGTWVTHLASMEPAYGEWRGTPGRRTVHAAVVDRLELA